jgi:hypothetical protein
MKHFIKTIYRIKNLLTVKQLINVVSYFIIFFTGLGKPLFRRKIFLYGMSEGTGDDFME